MKKQDVLDVKVGAFEGGINYWADIKRGEGAGRDDQLNYVGDWIVIERDDEGFLDGPKEHVLTDALLRKGIERAAKHYGLSVEAFLDDWDAERADVAVQFAVLGEIVYG